MLDGEVEGAVAPLRGSVKLVFDDLGQVRQPDGAAGSHVTHHNTGSYRFDLHLLSAFTSFQAKRGFSAGFYDHVCTSTPPFLPVT